MTKNRSQTQDSDRMQKSTGPRTSAGKAISSQNARRHGATSKPPQGLVSSWLSVILNRPDMDATSFAPSNEIDHAALRLASAEARLTQCQNALAEFVSSSHSEDEDELDVDALYKLISNELEAGKLSIDIINLVGRFIDHVEGTRFDIAFVKRSHGRLLKRYVREAQTGRSSALKRWIEVSQRVEHAT